MTRNRHNEIEGIVHHLKALETNLTRYYVVKKAVKQCTGDKAWLTLKLRHRRDICRMLYQQTNELLVLFLTQYEQLPVGEVAQNIRRGMVAWGDRQVRSKDAAIEVRNWCARLLYVERQNGHGGAPASIAGAGIENV